MKLRFFTISIYLLAQGLFAQTAIQVPPPYTDSRIKNFTDFHYCYEPTASTQNVLVLFLPGTGAIPQYYQLFSQKAARMGYHSIGLTYNNAVAIGNACATSLDTNCHGKARMEVLTGKDLNPDISVDRVDCIENRLSKLIYYLNTTYPGKGWGQYLINDSTVAWDKIIVSGHSQGAGHALYISKIYSVYKAIAFAGMDYNGLKNKPASWAFSPGETNASNLYCFTHTKDELLPYSNQKKFWNALGLDKVGSITSVDTTAWPYGNSHTLITEQEPFISVSTPYHNATIVSAYVPRTGMGDNTLEIVWQYLLAANKTRVVNYGTPDVKFYWDPAGILHCNKVGNSAILYSVSGQEIQRFETKYTEYFAIRQGIYFVRSGNTVFRFVKAE